MQKIRLELDDLQVESFPTSKTGGARGTVVGAQYTLFCTQNPEDCQSVTINAAMTPCGLDTQYECTEN